MAALHSHQAQLAADLLEPVERELQVLARVSRGHDGADAGLVTRDRRERDRLREYAFFEQAVRQLVRLLAVTRDHRCDRALAEAGVESEPLETLFEEARVLPQAVNYFGLLH